jgi:hypothetical protein
MIKIDDGKNATLKTQKSRDSSEKVGFGAPAPVICLPDFSP